MTALSGAEKVEFAIVVVLLVTQLYRILTCGLILSGPSALALSTLVARADVAGLGTSGDAITPGL